MTGPTKRSPVYRTAVPAGERHVRARPARLLDDQGRVDEAIQVVREAIADGGPEAYGTLSWLLTRERRLDDDHFAEVEQLRNGGDLLALRVFRRRRLPG